MSSNADPVAVVNLLNEVFSDFDDLAAKHGLEKIKTIGDAYMVAAGLPAPRADHLATLCLILKLLHCLCQFFQARFDCGMDLGCAVSGYDLQAFIHAAHGP
ncbi:MAG: adenylate/guanylate cyclase domain-containing protein [Candidatus Promineifilaceae bacterium]